MPKKVDHQARRLELAEALWRVTRRAGWDAVSVRKVAAEAGVSVGMVQHYFTTKDELLRFAFEMIDEDVRQRIRGRIADLPQPHTPRRLVGTVLTEMIPQPSRRQTEADAATVFLERFSLPPEHATQVAAGAEQVRNGLIDQIRLARANSGDARAAERDADGLLALLDGLILHIVTGQLTSESALEILETQLDRVLGTE